VSEIRIINTYDQMKAAQGDRIAILKQNADYGRGGHGSGWHVHRVVNGVPMQTDRNGHWSDHGFKYFSSHRGGHAGVRAALAEAIAWAINRYGQREFVRNRWGDYVEREVNEAFPIPKEPR